MEKRIILSAVIIALNEQGKIETCLRSLDFVDEIIVLDSGSTDRTREIAAQYQASVSLRDFDSYASQKNAAIDQARGVWILSIDADECVSPELRNEIIKTISQNPPFEGFWLNRRNYIFGGPMHFGASGIDRQLRLFKKGSGQFEGLVHERIHLKGREGKLKGNLVHRTSQTTEEYFGKFNRYIKLEAEQYVQNGKRWVFVHMLLKPFAEFIYFYIIRLGFLDGWRGFKYQLFSSFYTFCKFKEVLRLRSCKR